MGFKISFDWITDDTKIQMIISIDGYSATGKSTLACRLAEKMGYKHLNSGLFFRAICFNLLSNGIDKSNYQDNIEKIKEATAHLDFELEDLEKNILKLKAPEINDLGTQIAKLSFVRDRVTKELRAAAINSNVVVDGRDIGTEIFPNADINFFFRADTRIRAIRLGKERKCKDYEAIEIEIERRDKEDEVRKNSPLKRPDDAIDIDTSHKSVSETLELLELYVNEIRRKACRITSTT